MECLVGEQCDWCTVRVPGRPEHYPGTELIGRSTLNAGWRCFQDRKDSFLATAHNAICWVHSAQRWPWGMDAVRLVRLDVCSDYKVDRIPRPTDVYHIAGVRGANYGWEGTPTPHLWAGSRESAVYLRWYFKDDPEPWQAMAWGQDVAVRIEYEFKREAVRGRMVSGWADVDELCSQFWRDGLHRIRYTQDDVRGFARAANAKTAAWWESLGRATKIEKARVKYVHKDESTRRLENACRLFLERGNELSDIFDIVDRVVGRLAEGVDYRPGGDP